MKKLFLIDAYALIFRFYYAFISNPMRNSEGLNTSAIYGFTKFINDILVKEKPEYFGVAFDPKGGSFRKRLYPLYKANRSATPEDIIASVPYIKQILVQMDIPILEVADYEADDVIGTVAKRAAKEGLDVYMVTPDKDYGQLIEDNIKMYKPQKGGMSSFEIITKDIICQKYSIDDPIKVIDILALWGDAADNVPGVPGVGEKSAIKLVSAYGNIDGIYENIEKLKGKQKENIIAHREDLALAKELVTIVLDVPIEFNIEKLLHTQPDVCGLIGIFKELGFSTMIRDLEAKCGHVPAAPMKQVAQYSSNLMETNLFSEYEATTLFPEHEATTLFPEYETQDLFAKAEIAPLFEEEIYQTTKSTTHTYTLIDTQKDVDLLVDLIEMKKEFCFDTETTGLNPILDELVGISISLEKNKAYYITNNGQIDFSKRLKGVFEDKTITKIGQNIKFDILVLKSIGIEVNGILYDTMIMQYLINPDLGNGMDYMALSYLNYQTIKIDELINKGAKQITLKDVEINRVVEYACEDADITIQLKEILWDKLCETGLKDLYLNIEEPLIKVLADIEYTGVKIDREALENYSEILSEELAKIELKIREFAGEEININSAKQIGVLLFEKLKITDKPKRTKTKQYKTDEEYLLTLKSKHEVVELILEYRGLKKLLSTYIISIIQLINPKTNRVHTTYNQALTRTGRLSSNNPNLQNIPIRTSRGEVIRKAFVAENDSKVLVAADYSQVELRVMAHLSQDEGMIEAFITGEDIHSATAAKIYQKPISEVTKSERGNAKGANFGIIYGISEFGLANNMGIKRTEARKLIDGYFESYPNVKSYMEKTVQTARENGYSETIYHRRRFLEDINSGNTNTRSFAERNAINAPIQGSAADIMKLAMISLHTKIKEEGLTSKIILQVHDELVLEVDKSELDRIIEITRESMSNIVELRVPLTVDIRHADNWLDAH